MNGVALGEITALLGGELIGDAALRVDAVRTLEEATPHSIAFLASPNYVKQLATTRAGCVIVGPEHADLAARRGAAIVSPEPYLYFARLTQWWAGREAVSAAEGIHATASVAADAVVAADATIGPCAVVESGASLGRGVVVGAHAVIGRGARVGEATRIGPRVSLLRGSIVGARCILHAGAVIGADGFGFAPDRGRWVKIEQLGIVRIGDDVEIGANTCIDRGALGDTTIGDGVKIDNLVQIGHNVKIGDHTAIAGGVGIAGSAVIGARCMIGGGAGITGHVSIADGTTIGGATQISSSIRKAGFYSGSYPFEENRSWEKNAATLRNLYALRERVRALEKKSS